MEFPSIAKCVHHQHRRVRGVGFPIDILDKGFKHTQVENSFPFEEIGRDKVKIKSIPISFQWASKGRREVQTSTVENRASAIGGGKELSSKLL